MDKASLKKNIEEDVVVSLDLVNQQIVEHFNKSGNPQKMDIEELREAFRRNTGIMVSNSSWSYILKALENDGDVEILKQYSEEKYISIR